MYMLIMLISHTISDFIIQSGETVKEKNELKLKAYLLHGLGLLITSVPILFLVKFNEILHVLLVTLVIIIVHLIIDFIKEILFKGKIKATNPQIVKLLLFIIDQVLHIFIIIAISRNLVIEFNSINQFLMGVLWINNGISYSDLKSLFVVLYASFSGTIFIPLIFDVIYKNVKDYNNRLNEILKSDNDDTKTFIDEVKTGKWIGILERIILSVFLFLGQIASIGFVIAAKSLARFKMMDNKIFSEYFLLGTFISVIYTILIFAVFNRIL